MTRFENMLLAGVMTACCLLVDITVNATPLPNLGDVSQTVLSVQHEALLAKYYMRAIREQTILLNDPLINDYLNNLGYQLVSYSPRPTQTFHFFIIQDPQINAFTGPSAHIGVNTGLIRSTSSEDELAAVLAHEIGHVVQGHVARSYAAQQKMTLPALGALLAAIVISTQSPQVGMGAISAATAGMYQETINTARGYEEEADRVGMDILEQAGFNPRSMPRFFTRLEKDSRLNGYDIPALLRTHPLNQIRLADAYNRSDQYPSRHDKNSLEFDLIKARVIALTEHNPAELMRKLQASNTKNRQRQYLYTLALLKNHQPLEAQKALTPLLKQYPNNEIIKMVQIDIEQASGHSQHARELMERLYRNNPDYYPIIAQYAHLLIRQNQPKKASLLLEKCYDSQHNNEGYLVLLEQALGLSQQRNKIHQVRAEIYQLNGNTRGAISQLKMAMQYTKDAMEKKVIEEKIKQLKTQAT